MNALLTPTDGSPPASPPPARAAGMAGPLTSTEMQLLLLCARVRLDSGQRARLAELIEAPLDWPWLLRMALRHKLAPLLAVHLRDRTDRLPPEARRYLAGYALDNARLVLQAVGELTRLRARFEDEGVPSVPYKGPVLGAQLYSSSALRQAGDLDVLVAPRDVPRARALLLEQGYRPRHALSSDGESFMLRSRYSETFDHDTAATVELHWAFTNRDIAFPLGLDDLWPNLEPVAVGGASFPGFGREDLLLVLCVHGSKHRWDRLEWLCGVAEAVRGAPSLDWDRLVERATRLGVRRMLLLGVLLAHDLLKAPVPTDVLRAARTDAAVADAAMKVPGFLTEEASTADADSLPTDLFRYQLRERWRDRARFIAYRVTTPSRPESWAAVSVGRWLVPLHGFVRPFRLFGRAASLLRGRVSPRR